MANLPLKMPYFCRGAYEKLEAALAEGGMFEKLDRIVWCYLTDLEHQGMLALVYQDKSIHLMVGDNQNERDAIAAMQSVLTSVQSDVNALSDELQTVDATVSEHTAALTTLEESMTELRQQQASFSEELDHQQDVIDGLAGRLSDDEDILANQDARIAGIQSSNSELRNDFAALSGNIASMEGRLIQHDDRIADLETASGNHASELSFLTDKTDALLEEVAETAEGITALAESIGDTGTDEETGEPLTVTEYVNAAAEEALTSAKNYADSVMTLKYI